MKKLFAAVMILLILAGCSSSGDNKPAENKNNEVSFEAYIRDGETFTFSFDPEEVRSYQELKNGISEIDISSSNWRSYFDLKEVYREHYEYDDEGKQTSTYMKGSFYTVELLDAYYYGDNWSRNGMEYEILIDGEETRVITNDGKTYDPVTEVYAEPRYFSGADPMLIMSDFTNSWDDVTVEQYSGKLNGYEMLKISNSNGNIKLLDASLIEFKNLKDDIYYFVACDSTDEYFVIFFESPDGKIERENEYYCAVYHGSADGEPLRYTGYTYEYPWAMVIEMLSTVNDN